jgi:hypothetical protein
MKGLFYVIWNRLFHITMQNGIDNSKLLCKIGRSLRELNKTNGTPCCRYSSHGICIKKFAGYFIIALLFTMCLSSGRGNQRLTLFHTASQRIFNLVIKVFIQLQCVFICNKQQYNITGALIN